MQITSSEFTYNPDNLKAFSFNLFLENGINMEIVFIIIISLFVLIVFYICAPYIYWYILVKIDDNLKIKNKWKVQEFILMKEVQNELEQEMEQVLLNAALTEKTN